MSVKATLLIDGIEINVLAYDLDFRQEMDANNRPKSIPRLNGFTVTIESQKEVHLASWAIAHHQAKQLQLAVSPVTQTSKTRTLHLFDCHLVGWYNRFSSTGVNPKTETLNITCGGIREDADTLEYSEPWRTTFDVPPPESSEEEEEEEKKLVDYYLTDDQGNEIEAYEIGNIIVLNIETLNRTGDSLTINLDDNEFDFKYNGSILENDTIENLSISGDLHKISLEVVAQKE